MRMVLLGRPLTLDLMELMLIIAAVVMLVPVLVLWIDDERDHMRQTH